MLQHKRSSVLCSSGVCLPVQIFIPAGRHVTRAPGQYAHSSVAVSFHSFLKLYTLRYFGPSVWVVFVDADGDAYQAHCGCSESLERHTCHV